MMVAQPTLFSATLIADLEHMQTERAALIRRIGALPPRSHRRVMLQGRAARLTHRIMRTESELQSEADQ